ncbi:MULTISPECIES: DEAD/DEAH box helicase [Pseudomonadati]|uniref:DEAD/DEAH box helicase n=1 Tax=Shewanella aestuarii TaxID=1028752 RepID=A0ABT0L0B5_9GAMM|nr:DEAD/DEAH box helicase [Shewanella aestuarii]MCL1116920.1 DEAD/DEAH box helicase [Shewanella aestuarii]GGN78380.1 DEAD/DEAH box helicase [Shewanella aestuarii]
MTLTVFSLHSGLVDALPASVAVASPIQQQAIPAVLSGKDVLALAQTGSGKTYAYGLPLLHRINQQVKAHCLSAVIIVPTRELASQVGQSLIPLAQAVNLKLEVLCGGEDIAVQVERLTTQVNIIVATPGRLLALAQQNLLHFADLQALVLDEADRLLDMGFINDLNALLALMPTRQTLLFSATMPEPLAELASKILSKPYTRVAVSPINSPVDDITQTIYHVNKGSKAKVLIEQIKLHQWSQVLVFVNAKDDADALCKKLLKAGINTAAMHGDKQQLLRAQTLAQFQQQQLTVLIATDVLARGIHIEALPVVINFELPPQATVYVHRIGRTARAGLSGIAVSLVSHAELPSLEAIRQLTGHALPLHILADYPVTDKPSAADSKRPPRDKQANRRTANKKSMSDFAKRTRSR